MTALSCCQDLDLQLASRVLLLLEAVALGQQQQQQKVVGKMPGSVLGSSGAAAATSAAAAATGGGGSGDAIEDRRNPGSAAAWVASRQQQQQQEEESSKWPDCSSSVGAAVDTTLRHLAQQEGVQQSEAVLAWRALRALCWCQVPAAREAARGWLQKLIAAALDLALQGTIPLPLPSLIPTTTPSPSASARDSGCNLLQDLFMQLTSHCPGGPELLVDSLQLHISIVKAAALRQQHQQLPPDFPPHVASDAEAGAGGGVTAERARAAAARAAVQGWVLVLQWVLAGSKGHCRGAMQQLAEMALRMACVDMLPLQLLVPGDNASSCCSPPPAGASSRGPVTAAAAVAAAAGSASLQQDSGSNSQQQQGGVKPQQPQEGPPFRAHSAVQQHQTGKPLMDGGDAGGGLWRGDVDDMHLSWVPTSQGFLLGLQEVPEVSTDESQERRWCCLDSILKVQPKAWA